MLVRLTIQDVVLIDRLTVPFERGLNVFTGETGAGKSILLDALSLALGGRGDTGLIRAGQNQAAVTAEFTAPLPSALTVLLEEQGLSVDDDLLVLRRTVSLDGKSRAFVCDQPIGITLLKRIGELLLEVHGQFETHGLLNAGTHIALLDAFAGHDKLRDETAESYAAWKRAQRAFDDAQSVQSRARDEEIFLKMAMEELDQLSPQPDEIAQLTEKRLLLLHQEKIRESLQLSAQSLTHDKGAIHQTAQAAKTLARLLEKLPTISNAVSMLDRAAEELNSAADVIDKTLEKILDDGSDIETVEDRLYKLRALARKHNVPESGLAELYEQLKSRYTLMSDQGDQMIHLAQQVGRTRDTYTAAAQKLSNARTQAAKALAISVMAELKPLKLERASFMVECTALPEASWGAEGMDRVTFLAATNKGAPAAPLHKVASGGELARFMLAIKVVLSKATPVPTLVFDEVDAGIGGATASAVGERLADLSRDVQTLVVTHSPQIAARGHHHLRVVKQEKGKYPTTIVTPLDQEERTIEIARMLAGSEITQAAINAAKTLLKDSAPAKPKAPKARP